MVGFMEESFSVWLQLTHVAERNMWQHLQSLQRILLLHCTLLMYFSQVYFLIVFLNCISQVYFSSVFLTWPTETRDNICSVCNWSQLSPCQPNIFTFFGLLLSQWNMFHTQFDCMCWVHPLSMLVKWLFALAVHISKIYLSIVFLNYKLCLIGCWAGWVLPTGFPTLHGVMLHWLPPPDAIINQLSVKFEKLWKKSCEQATVANYVILQPAGFSQNESCILFRDHGYS